MFLGNFPDVYKVWKWGAEPGEGEQMLGKGGSCAQEQTWNIQSSSLGLQLPH